MIKGTEVIFKGAKVGTLTEDFKHVSPFLLTC